MVFDEETSALDTQTEREIQDALGRAAEGCTTLVIAHRLSTKVDADEIIVLDQGRIAERGRHHAPIGRAHVCTPATNAQLACRLRLAKRTYNRNNKIMTCNHSSTTHMKSTSRKH